MTFQNFIYFNCYKLRIFFWLISFCILSQSFAKQTRNDNEIDALIKKMTIEEKVAQMRIFHANMGISLDKKNNLVLSNEVREALKYGIAGIKNPGQNYTPEQSAILNNLLQEYIISKSRLKIPAFFITESYNGVDANGCTRFGRPITLSSSWDVDIVKSVYDCMGREARIRGLHLTHSPEADIVRDPRFGRMSETFGEDTYLVTQMIINAVNGLQGDNLKLSTNYIGAVVKHFAGYAQVAGGRNFASVEISPRTLIDEILPPFKEAVEKCNVVGVMTSHGDINGVSCHANKELLDVFLRKQWRFKGYVVSDANDINRLFSFMHTAKSEQDAVAMALKAGMDVDLYSNNAYALLPQMVKDNPSLMPFIDKAVKRVLLTKYKLGLFNNPFSDLDYCNKVRDDKAIALAKKADEESIILLKNNDSLLPLSSKVKSIALVGPNVNESTERYFRDIVGSSVTILTEKGFSLTNLNGNADGDADGGSDVRNVNLTNDSISRIGIEKIMKVAKKADVVILFVGGNPFTSREAFFNNALGDRADLNLVGLQDELIDSIKTLNKPMVGILKHRRTLSAVNLSEKADALLDCWELSEFGDNAIASVLFGKVNPSGKLPVTVPRTIGQIPFHYSQKQINNKKGYLFIDNTPLYPFGYGLSYTSFKYSNFNIDKKILKENDSIRVSVDITNTGRIKGKEIVQLYIQDVVGEVLRPAKELKGFKKIELESGERKTVTFNICPEMLKYTGLDMKPIIDDGEFIVSVGYNSRDLNSLSFRYE